MTNSSDSNADIQPFLNRETQGKNITTLVQTSGFEAIQKRKSTRLRESILQKQGEAGHDGIFLYSGGRAGTSLSLESLSETNNKRTKVHSS